MTFDFTLKLDARETGDQTTELADRLYAAGCDDGLCFSRDGQVYVSFTRGGDSLQDAARTAIADVTGTGVNVLSIEIEADELSRWPA